MIDFGEAVYLFEALPGELQEIVSDNDFREKPEAAFLAHPAMVELFHFIVDCPDPANDTVQAIVKLVSSLYLDGDRDCKDLVVASFIHNLEVQPEGVIYHVTNLFSSPMQKAIDDVFALVRNPKR